MADFVVGAKRASAIGDIRAATAGDIIVLRSGATARSDWSRYADAIGVALARGADVRRDS